MIPTEEKEGWHYPAVKNSCIITWKNVKTYGNFYFLNCPHSSRTEYKLKSHGQVRKNKDFFAIVMPSKKDNILEFQSKTNND